MGRESLSKRFSFSTPSRSFNVSTTPEPTPDPKPPVPPPVMPVSPINEPEPDLLPDEAPNPNQDEHKDPQIRVASFRPSELIFSFFGT
ncbi:hypothetical protein GFL86_07235 [Rhizobium laguerreae]|nr:hypothetical protein [Rhizobium laguerreae]